MADNLVVSAGSYSATMATKDTGTAHAQRVTGMDVSTYHRVATSDANAANVKASAGTLLSVHIFNAADYAVHVKFHNTAGTPTPGAGVAFTVSCPAGRRCDLTLPGGGRAFATGIGISMVQGLTDADTTALVAGDCILEVCYV